MEKNQGFINGISLLPPKVRTAFLDLETKSTQNVEEIRLRVGTKPKIYSLGKEICLEKAEVISGQDLQMVLEIATRASVHSYIDSIKKGFITAKGGIRLGLCGLGVVGNSELINLRNISSICIRLPHEILGCSDNFFPKLNENGLKSTLIISPPSFGKTTLLRELIRKYSNFGTRVCVLDERMEISGGEIPWGFSLGETTDVLCGVSKKEGLFMLLRSMSPELLAFDEITEPSDIEVAEKISNCGVKLLSTIHGDDVESLLHRRVFNELLERKIFQQAVIIRREGIMRRYEVVNL